MRDSIVTGSPFDIVDSTFNEMDNMWMQLFNSPFSTLKKMKDNGISVISRPHNVYSIKDKNGKVIGNKLEVVTTPFKKDDVSVEVRNGILHVECNSTDDATGSGCEISAFECEIHRGISAQSYSFSLKLSDKVDKDSITAENKDGILTIVMPFVKDTEKRDEVRKISVS